ncbi:hypothetical protein [Candidatus Nitrosotenuis uzonensis]|uniref:Uncharacterized protein n=1 Tax=Candidatus Nitrosotenuis uzonensis TaxID=1407055 RepID=A0A812F778_9ARCH|nr:hypothetical protein [Candidatus Nitrosotenuis uzonensis]CAE6502205.1 hypothetical protein NUZ5A_51251 [Candidatus Nitrosotenuis uzonensis]
MISKNHAKSEWREGYVNNVWCKFKTFLSPTGDLFVIAKKDFSIRVFKLKKKLVEKHQHEELNDVIKFAQEITSSKIPQFVRKEISK